MRKSCSRAVAAVLLLFVNATASFSQAINPGGGGGGGGGNATIVSPLGAQTIPNSVSTNPATSSVWSTSSPFLTGGTYVNVPSVTTSVANSALPTGSPPSIGVWNYGANRVAVKLSASGTAAGTFATADAVIGSGSCQQLSTTGFTNLNYLTDTGTSSLQIVAATSGTLIGCGGGSSASASGNVFQATEFAQGSVTSAATTQVIAASGSEVIYLVNYAFQTDGAATANGTLQIVSGTGTNCSTINQHLTPVWNFTASNGIGEGPIGVLGQSSAGDELCIVTTSTSSSKINYRIGVAQQ